MKYYKNLLTGNIRPYDDWIEAFDLAVFQMEISLTGIEYFQEQIKKGYFEEVKNEKESI